MIARSFACFVLGSITLGACADVTLNEPAATLVAAPSPSGGMRYEWPQLAAAGHDPELLVVVAMSGGGKRSSSFSYGILKGLRDFELRGRGPPRRLLDEIDIVSGASGGSFTGAYYALHREGIFADYEREFLRRDSNNDIARLLLLPWNVWHTVERSPPELEQQLHQLRSM